MEKHALSKNQQTLAGRNFRDFANFLVVHESVYPQNWTLDRSRNTEKEEDKNQAKMYFIHESSYL